MEYRHALTDAIEAMVQDAVKQIVYGDSSVAKLLEKIADEEAKVALYKRLIRAHGKLSDVAGKKYTLKDLLTSAEFTYYFPRVIEEMAVEVWENQLVVTPLLEEVMVDPGPSLTITVPQFTGAFGQNLDVGEGAEYPELTLKFGAGAIAHVVIGKSGIAVSITKETIEFSRFDVLNAAINEALKALARWKEHKALKMFQQAAKVVKNGGSGLDLDGNPNGGLTLDDLLEVAVQFMEKGFNMDTIIMHPLAYPIFTLNGTLRSFFWRSLGEKGEFFSWPKLNGMGQPKPYEIMGKTTHLGGRNIVSFELPTGILGKPLRLILSPAVPFNAETKETDIYVVDSANVGWLFTAERPTTEEFADPIRDIQRLKIRERYGMAPKYDGSAIGIIKGVRAVETFDPRPFWIVNK